MKLKSIFFLLIFSWCILTPALVTFCNIDTNLSALFSMNEEETSDTYKLGLKEYPSHKQAILKFSSTLESRVEMNFGTTNHFWNSLAQETFSPPPEQTV
ncbi:hypothetical protein [Rasiella sp. SM2506]|uniref:hypothetical protein n=1 Tax=Rasiella sp. SM2506 TaxID=3423914 RepID=UPI003D795578